VSAPGRFPEIGTVQAAESTQVVAEAPGRSAPTSGAGRTGPETGDPVLVVGIAGGSGAGKTTLAEALVETLGEVVCVRHDDYYRHRPDLTFEERSRVNYDHPDAFDTELCLAHLDTLRRGRAVERPVYDFARHLRSTRTVYIPAAPIVVVEGILVLADPRLRRSLDLKVYVDAEPDVRLARRIRRDIRERGRSWESVLDQYFRTVRPMHLRFVEPSKRYADLIVPGEIDAQVVTSVVEAIGERSRR
jgi:uridine kinase